MNMDQALQTFLDESRELLIDMERILLELESDPGDAELNNALFRCVHTIKGSAGMFGLDHVVNFTHVVENVMDRLRAQEIPFNAELANLLLRCRDHISLLVEIPEAAEALEFQPQEVVLLAELAPYHSLSASVEAAELDQEKGAAGAGVWHLSIRVDPEALRHGMDPFGFIRYLGNLGDLISVTSVCDSLPALSEYDPEVCYLGFEVDLYTDAVRQTIEEVFEFAGDLYQLHLIRPGSALSEFKALLDSVPEASERLGEILVSTGAITQAALDECLRLQSEPALDMARPIGEILIAQGAVASELVDAALQKQTQARERRGKTVQHLRIPADKLDKLINLVGEMVIASAAVGLHAEQSGNSEAREAAATLNLLVEEIRDSSLDLRMVPIGDTFQRFQRVVRDLSSELGKDIQLQITGADTELDKTVVEIIADPLTHLVRNACDHGIEVPSQRLQQGKPAQGKVSLNAYHESGAIVIEVSDDGSGLNRDCIVAKAVERGLIGPETVLSDQEVFNLIFEPGFSTVDEVTNLSGRGVGMDVVRRNIQALRGQVEVLSPGIHGGTSFRIRLPLTLAIIDGFLARVGDATYVVPLEAVVECTELNTSQKQRSDSEYYINLRDQVLPLIPLRDHFQVSGASGRRQNIIVVQHAGQKAGLVVDDLLGEHQTVIKPLSGLFAHIKGLSGSTILGSGQVALILDVPSLIHQIALHEDAASRGIFQNGRTHLSASNQ